VATYDRDIVRVLDEGVPPTPTTIERGFDGVLAVDKWHRWAAAYTLWVASNGEWSSDIHLFQRTGSGWQAMVVSGSHGPGRSKWPPQVDHASRLRLGERGGQDAEEEDESEVSLIALTGYAAPGVEGVEVRHGGEVRVIPVVHDLNAFVVLGPAGERTLRAVDLDGAPLGPPIIEHCSFGL
jgi:hypothetical protein